MATRPIRVWSGSDWEDVAIAPYDSGEFLSAATASATYIPDSIINAKGDLIVGSANDTPAILTAGSNGQMLMADSSATAGLRYVDPPANRNLIINSAMQVHQRGTSSTGITTSGYYTADRWYQSINSIGTFTHSIETDAPSGSGLNKSFKILCTTADAAPAAADRLWIQQSLEGQDLQRIKKGTSNAEQLTISFWVKSNVTGTFVCTLVDFDNTRMVTASYSISASATWEKKSITFPADTTGAFDNDNAASLAVIWFLGAGTNWTSGTLQTTWGTEVNANRAVGQTNLAAATNNYWQITGVQLETGPVATPFEFEPYEATLRKCQRYFIKYGTVAYEHYFVGVVVGSTVTQGVIDFPVVMRTSPTLANSTTYGDYIFGNSTNFTPTNIVLDVASPRQATVSVTSSGMTGGQAMRLFRDNLDNGYLDFSAEL